MADTAGKQGEIRVKGTSGSGTELTKATSVGTTLSPNLLNNPQFGDEGQRRIQGILDGSFDIEGKLEDSPSNAVTDLRDSAINGTELTVEFSPDGNASGGPNDVYQIICLCSEFTPDTSVGSENTFTATVENSDGTKPSVKGSFSI